MALADDFSTTPLLANIRRKGHIPPAQSGFSDTDLLAIADDELRTSLMRQIQSVHENYYLTFQDLTLTSDGFYAIPPRAIGGTMDTIKIVNGTQVLEVARIEQNQVYSTVTSPTGYYGFILAGNKFQIQPNAGIGVIRVYYNQRPNTLIAVSAAAQITGISGGVLTCSAVPSTILTTTTCDIISAQPYFDCWAMDLVPTAVTGSSITFSSVPSTVSVGDWVCLSGQSPIPQLPIEFRPLLVQRTVVKYCEAMSYLDKMRAGQEKLKEMEKDLFEIINPRVREEPKRIVPDSNIIGGYKRWRAWRAT